MPTASPDPADVPTPTPLTKLLRRVMDENEWGLRDVCRPPDGTREGGPARSTMSKHLQDGYWLKTMPRPTTRTELAKAIGVDVIDVENAAWRSLEVNRDRPEQAFPPEVAYLSRRDQGPSLADASMDELLAEIAKRARANNPDANR